MPTSSTSTPVPPATRPRPAAAAPRRGRWLRAASLSATLLVVVLLGCSPTTSRLIAPAPVTPTVADGRIPDGGSVSPEDERLPAVSGLDPALLQALQLAAEEARDDDVELRITSGWRSQAYQEWLWQRALVTHGSAEEASRWVAPADTSTHLTGDAVDIGPWDASYWLGVHGADFGLCQVYVNEPWHFELRPGADVDGCPDMYLDATDDPRLRS